MYLRGNAFSSRHEDYHLATAVGIVVAGYAGFFLILYWLMQPSITTNPGLAAYRPPPKTVVHYADSPWVPPAPEPFPIRAAEPAAPIAKRSVTEEPKKETKKQEQRTTARRTQPVTQQPNPFWGWGQGQGQGWGQGQASSRGFGSRPWF
jgi:hypothetical protein